MTTFAIDETTGDLAVSANQLVLVRGADEVVQTVRSALRTIRGEWYLDETLGMPFRETIWVKGTPITAVYAAIIREVTKVPGVLGILAFEPTVDSALRKLSISLDLKVTDDDVVTVSEVFS